MKWLKGIAAVFVLLAGIGAVSYLQYRFDRSDIRHAVEAVKLNRHESGCEGSLLSRWKGWVRVRCQGASYQVDVVKGVLAKDE